MIPGRILFHKQFVFSDGASADKYLVVLGVTGNSLVVAKTTSKGRNYRNDHGCQAGSYFPAFLLTAGCCCLPLNTWICLGEFYELKKSQVSGGIVTGAIRMYGLLTPDLIKDVQVCAVSTDDISAAQEGMIRAHF
jgi:hypothetical protein